MKTIFLMIAVLLLMSCLAPRTEPELSDFIDDIKRFEMAVQLISTTIPLPVFPYMILANGNSINASHRIIVEFKRDDVVGITLTDVDGNDDTALVFDLIDNSDLKDPSVADSPIAIGREIAV